MSLVLQMPRGNLETINPRPLVMEVVKQDLDAWVSPTVYIPDSLNSLSGETIAKPSLPVASTGLT